MSSYKSLDMLASPPPPPPAHSYLLLVDKGKGYSRGRILEWSGNDKYGYHSHWFILASPPEPISVKSDEVAALTERECRILDSDLFATDQYTMYSTPGKLAWGVGLKVGDTVLARLPSKGHISDGKQQEDYTAAVIRWHGETRSFHYMFGVEITDKRHYGRGDTDGTFKSWPLKRYFRCPEGRGLFLTLSFMKPWLPPNEAMEAYLQEQVSQLQSELRSKTLMVERLFISKRKLKREASCLQDERREKDWLQEAVREKEATIARLREEGRENTRLQQEVREKDAVISEMLAYRMEIEARDRQTLQDAEGTIDRLQREMEALRDQLASQREHHVTELQQARRDAEQYQQQWRDEQAQHQQLTTRINEAMANLRGETATPQQALQLWELPREEVHISQTLLGTGGWGYVARGTFQGQAVAVKCLHREILSAQNEGRVRREISIMAQVRHPNLLLLIGAVLTTEGEGPLIITELLDRSLRSAYQDGVLEVRSKLPILRDVASALTYLHSCRTPIIHRDVSSANVLLESTGNERQWKAKLSDFGSANLSHRATTPAEGAAVYAAPEVSTEDRSRQTAKIDVYSFGVLACEVCLCRFPPERQEFPSMLREVRGAAPNMFPVARDCTSHTHQDRPGMRDVLQCIDQLTHI